MEDEEKTKYIEEKEQMKEVFRNEDIKHFNLLIKASSTGALETLLQETEKKLGGLYRISIIESGVGPVTEKDLATAESCNATILAFDVTCSPAVVKRAAPCGVIIRQHRIIYKFLEDVQNYVKDAKAEIEIERGKAPNIHVLGSANIS